MLRCCQVENARSQRRFRLPLLVLGSSDRYLAGGPSRGMLIAMLLLLELNRQRVCAIGVPQSGERPIIDVDCADPSLRVSCES
jgi:hypothetical protein